VRCDFVSALACRGRFAGGATDEDDVKADMCPLARKRSSRESHEAMAPRAQRGRRWHYG
jgi:hypothetical protein